MGTATIIQVACDVVGWTDVPPDCAVHHPCDNITTVLLGIDAGRAELVMARQLVLQLRLAHRRAPAAALAPPLVGARA